MNASLPGSISSRFAIASVLSLLVFAAAGRAAPRGLEAPFPTVGSVEKWDDAFDELVAGDAVIEKLAEGFNWSEGPAWMPREGRIVFSDVPQNIAYRWSAAEGLGVLLAPSGYTGAYDGARHQGSNGLAVDAAGRLVLCQHGDRRVARLEERYAYATIADRHEGRRFNSPNDLCFDRAGALFFTDPPYGIQGLDTKPELDFSGVFRVAPDGGVTLITRELARPNGIALSPDERVLYVTNSDEKRPVILAITLRPDGTPGASRVLFDGMQLPHPPAQRRGMDGMAVDARGNLWVTLPGGVLVITPEGKPIGVILTERNTGNCAFGGEAGTTLFITAADALLRIETRVAGATHGAWVSK